MGARLTWAARAVRDERIPVKGLRVSSSRVRGGYSPLTGKPTGLDVVDERAIAETMAHPSSM